jgi:hypothetical protein
LPAKRKEQKYPKHKNVTEADTGMREFTKAEYKALAARNRMEEIREDSRNAEVDSEAVPVPEPEHFSSDDYSVSDRMNDSFSDLASMNQDDAKWESSEEEEDAESEKSDPELDEINKLRDLYVSIKDCPAESDEQLAYRLQLNEEVSKYRDHC